MGGRKSTRAVLAHRLAVVTLASMLGAIAFALSGLRWSEEPPSSEPSRAAEFAGKPAQPVAERFLPAAVARTKKEPRLAPISSSLDAFHAALQQLETGQATRVTILHLGDSHIAADRITRELRAALQARFGDAGRGLLMPGFPFDYYRAAGVRFEKSGKWSAATSLRDEGTYGLTGVSLTAGEAGAELRLESTAGPFSSAEVTFLTGSGQGQAIVSSDAGEERVDTASIALGARRVEIPGSASSLLVKIGETPVTVLGWSLAKNERGLRYVNLGIPGASALTTRRWNPMLVTDDIRRLAPQLVVLGYGANEGFQDDLDLEAYERAYRRLIGLVRFAAPDASLLILGPMDSARLPRVASSKKAAELACRPLGPAEMSGYEALLAAKDPALARWHEPPKMAALREVLARVAAAEAAVYLDLARLMGGACTIHRWALARPPLAHPDHVHLSDEGAKRLAHVLHATLIEGYERYRDLSGGLAATAANGLPPFRSGGP